MHFQKGNYLSIQDNIIINISLLRVTHEGTPSIAETGKTRGQQTMLYFNHVAIFRSKF